MIGSGLDWSVLSGGVMVNRRVAGRLACALVALALARSARAQEHTGTLTGTVTDEQGQVLPGATVTVVNEETRHARTTTSDAKGTFLLTALPPGSYTVKVELASFRTEERKHRVLTAASRLSLAPFRLVVGLGESIVVEATGAEVSTEDSQHTGLITSTQIEQIQVKGRDVTTLMRLVPGVRYEDTVESLGESFGTLVPHVSGQRRDWNTIMIDGVLGNEIGQANRMAQQINLDAVAEIKVLLNTYRAEYGRTGGAQVQIVSKAGTSRYSGGAYYYGRHEALNANNFFNNSAGLPKARYRFNTYGVNPGGPLQRGARADKNLFFFYSLEAPLTERPGPVRRFTLPTEAERRGDFSQTLDSAGRLIVIRDPLTGQPFPGNMIPANRINSNGQALLKLMPLPNSLDRDFTKGQFNYQTQTTAENPKLNNVARVDWRPSARDTLYFTFKDWYSDQRGSEVTAGPAKWNWFNTHYLNTDRGGSVNYDRILHPNIVNEAAYGIRQQTEQFHPVAEADWQRIRKSEIGYTLGQFHPELNPDGVVPKATFGVPNSPDLTFDNRLNQKGIAW